MNTKRATIDEIQNLGEVRDGTDSWLLSHTCGNCGHPAPSHDLFPSDHGCYHTLVCTCIKYEPECDMFSATEPFKVNESDFEPKRDFSKLTRKLNLVKFFEARDKASGYEDFNHEEWSEQAHDLGVTEQEEAEWSELRAKDAKGEF